MADPSANDSISSPLTVVEVESGAAAAYAARLLADLGARVTKLTVGDATDDAAVALDAGKEVRAFSDDAELERLLAGADVLVLEGRDAALPLSADGARARHPRLISAQVTPFGESGPQAGWQGTDLTALHA